MSLLARRVWFYGTWVKVILAALVSGVFVLLFGLVGFYELRQGRWPVGVAFGLACVAMTAVLVQRWRRFFRDLKAGMRDELKRRNCCPHCEYDLRASTGRCPECGHSIADSIEV